MLADYVVTHSLPIRSIERDFPFIEDETRRRFCHLYGTYRKSNRVKRGIEVQKCIMRVNITVFLAMRIYDPISIYLLEIRLDSSYLGYNVF